MIGADLHKHTNSLYVETLADEISPFHTAASSLPADCDGRDL